MKTELHTNILPECTGTLPAWLWAIGRIIGAEGDGEAGDPGAGDDPDSDAGDDDDASRSSTDDSHDDSDDPKVKGLKSALESERSSNKSNAKTIKDLQRQLRTAQKAQEDRELAEKTEVEQAVTKAQKAEERAAKLATGLRNRELDAAIERAARDARFIDIDDALAGVDRSKITIEQDEDDPSDITVDMKTVIAEVKGLAARKKHLVQSGTEDGGATGSTFAGGGKGKGKTDEEDLKSRYPALR